ncbi:MAG: FkbM family methyltransferase [Bacteroidetes bacterium]|nr:FkbM family methyltransferase [Bacteroidota bacterium]
MKLALMEFVIRCYRFLFARRIFLPLNRFLHRLSLHGMGVLNFENDSVSGEDHFLQSFFTGKSASVVLDVGANDGRYCEKVLRFHPGTSIFAFEPHPLTYKRLEEKARSHGFTAINAGCGSSPGGRILYDYPDLSGSEHATVHRQVFTGIHERTPVEHHVRFITLDEFVVEQGLEKIDLVKIDVEGNELDVLIGFQKSLKDGKVDAIQFEFNSMDVVSRVFFKDFVELLEGYSFYRMLPDGLASLPVYDPVFCEIFAFQNIVALRRR